MRDTKQMLRNKIHLKVTYKFCFDHFLEKRTVFILIKKTLLKIKSGGFRPNNGRNTCSLYYFFLFRLVRPCGFFTVKMTKTYLARCQFLWVSSTIIKEALNLLIISEYLISVSILTAQKYLLHTRRYFYKFRLTSKVPQVSPLDFNDLDICCRGPKTKRHVFFLICQ